MSGLNVATLAGNLTRDAELAYTKTGTALVKFSIAQNESVKKNGEWTKVPRFYNCEMFGPYGEAVHKYLTKGTKVTVTGRWKYSEWEADGVKKRRDFLGVNELGISGNLKGDTGEKSVDSTPDYYNADIPF